MLSELKRKVTDIFSFILLSCPHFPPETKTSIAREFDELTELINAALVRIDDDRKLWLRTCLHEVQQSREYYEQGKRDRGMDLLQRAEEHFNNGFAGKTAAPRFEVGESGCVLDNNFGSPE